MPIRVALCCMFVAGFSIYAWRDWFVSLCASIILMAFLQHPDMPKSIFGVQGFNLWNLLLLNVVAAWLVRRHAEGLEWDLPSSLRTAFLLYCGVITWAFLRLWANPTEYYQGTSGRVVVDYLINPLKFFLPCIMLYDGCRTRERVTWALGAIVLLYLLLALQITRHTGFNFDFSSANEFSSYAARMIHRSVGYHRVDMSMMLAGASWATLVFSRLMPSKPLRWACWGAFGIILLAQAMTGGRAGYVTWGLVGLVLGLVKWRKLLLLLPLVVLLLIATVPAVRERMMEGFGSRDGAFVEQTDVSEITSGRTNMWPYVIQKITEAPLLGYGRLGIVRTGLSDELEVEVGEAYGHPHNAYLEILLDDGIIGFLCITPLYVMIIRRSFRLFRQTDDIICETAGGVALALFLALVFAAFGAQTFYPREGVLGMWAAAGIVLRVWVERERSPDVETSPSDEDIQYAPESPAYLIS